MSAHAKVAGHLHLANYSLGIPHGRRSNVVSISLVALLLSAVFALGLYVAERLVSTPPTIVTASPRVELAPPRVPTRPVSVLERIDLSTVINNPTNRTIDNVNLELTVLQPDGTQALSARQTGIAVYPNDSRAVYWAWRVPAQLSPGEYGVQVRAFDGQGRLLSADQPQTVRLQVIGRDD